jgi:epoxyqueuosine reductase
MNSRERAELLKGWALEEGFDRAGVARLERSATGEAYLSWLERGEHADMAYLTRRTELRLDPRQMLDRGARTALCVALQDHPLVGDIAPEGDLWPWVARYARGLDYHDHFLRRLQRLTERITEAFPGSRSRPYVDTGPVLERELGVRAGLGAVGKNTNLLDGETGSWFFLGELFLDLELEPDRAAADLCGSCVACLEACPTGALPEPYRLDSNRCISYWTIEHRGVIPAEVRPTLGSWVFGCDICQEVCPVNTEPEARDHPELRLAEGRSQLDLAGLLNLGREGYVESFRGSPMKRAKQEGLQRNGAVAMGNSRDRRYVPALEAALENGSDLVRKHAAWALGRIGGSAAEEVLRRRLAVEESTAVQGEILGAIEEGAAASG